MNENVFKKLREPGLIRELTDRLKKYEAAKKLRIMEVCGTHTMAIHRMGLPALLLPDIILLSGPGCPVCVTPGSYLDTAFGMAREHGVTLATFGDMMRVPGSQGTLTALRSEGYAVEVVYSPLAALELAQKMPGQNIVFLAIGFETTAPAVAATLLQAREKNVRNFSILCSHKLVIPALKVLVNDPNVAVDGFMLPGHVSVVIGSEPYKFITETYHHACVITGFEPYDIIYGLFMLLAQIEKKEFSVEIQYKRGVRQNGNERAREYMFIVFTTIDAVWRGFGTIPQSGLSVRDNLADFDANLRFPVETEHVPEPEGCRCGEVLRGLIHSHDCPLFGSVCIPDNPVGPCMVSSEGTCAAFYRYSRTFDTFRG
ncbi:Hydrogenase maturation factor HypD [subsurface metagenome]